jgi:hypothetical protein
MRSLTVPLDEEEKARIGAQMTGYALEIKRIEDEKKKLKALQAEITRLAEEFERGHSNVDVRCRVYFNDPGIGEKTIVRTDNGEIVAIETMTSDELQEDIPFTEAEVMDVEDASSTDESHMLEAPTLPAVIEDLS